MHTGLGINKTEKNEIVDLGEQANISQCYHAIESTRIPHPAISGVALRDCCGCPFCPYVATKKVVGRKAYVHQTS
jgi:hypothetical protein